MSTIDSGDGPGAAADDSGPAVTGDAASPGWSDRVLGLGCLALAIWYTAEARTFEGTAFASGPVGPKTLPTGIGLLFGALSLSLIVRPDPAPRWPRATASWQIGLVLVSSYLYGQILDSTGFIVASAMMTIILGLLFRAPPRLLVPLSVAFPTVLAYVFNNWLELRLPDGWWGGF